MQSFKRDFLVFCGGKKIVVVWSPVVTKIFCLAANFMLSIWEFDFGVPPVSLSRLWFSRWEATSKDVKISIIKSHKN